MKVRVVHFFETFFHGAVVIVVEVPVYVYINSLSSCAWLMREKNMLAEILVGIFVAYKIPTMLVVPAIALMVVVAFYEYVKAIEARLHELARPILIVTDAKVAQMHNQIISPYKTSKVLKNEFRMVRRPSRILNQLIVTEMRICNEDDSHIHSLEVVSFFAS
jgi:hypothetical protein